MTKLEALILGFIQGMTEFLPISSTGHLYLGRHLFGLDEAGLFLDTMLHIGTLLAVFVIYKEELLYMLRKPFSKLTFLLIVGTVPAVVVGLLFKDYFEEISKTGVTIGWEFLITGMFLWFSDGIKHGYKRMEDITYTDAFVIGTFQAAAIFPAISRSGLTIVGGLFRKLDRETAAYFSFLLSIPAIAGAIVLQSIDLLEGQAETISLSALVVGTVSSAFFGYIAVRWMIRYLQKHSLKMFAIYVWALGLLVLAFQWTGKF
ncbi:undecaprenyl-diphosphatase [Anoxybacillus voinovskiensis]|uniref:Undecaprenyl-diphosphatase n=1 Tax=Anoxybacteroides voinovskiense TaxID=230470 RepID=A0A840DJZ2_9BACL|nr:undecaprenyl-diphosphate phosphatase [Anoxybacillus voinovskiensis]MBB4073621.1 undecaprenyl-diphosphatase [Anoxybacillus voinovskiensis]GGJ63291.1 undecaprenyl-diphosphatase 4 [Anoxybacillus voinovskiensis]